MIKSKRLRWSDHVARMEEGKSAFKILTDKTIGKRPLGSPRRIWKDNIRMCRKKYISIRGIVMIRLRIGIVESH